MLIVESKWNADLKEMLHCKVIIGSRNIVSVIKYI